MLKTSAKRKWFAWVVGVIILLHVVAFLLFFFQDEIIFQNKKLGKDFEFRFDKDPYQETYEEYFIATEDGEKLNALLFRTKLKSKGLILYFHGNADNLMRWGRYSVDFTKLGYDILMPDYRGYGKSTGKPTERDLYKDALTVSQWTQKFLTPKKLIIYGRSLGSSVASNLATAVTPELLILETPFDELKGVVYEPLKPLLKIFPLHSNFSNRLFLPKVKCRKIIIHGTLDQVVPLTSALKLKPLLGKDDLFVIVEGASHRNLRDFPAFHKTLADALN